MAGVDDGCADPVAGFTERRVGQTGHGETRQSLREIGLDLDHMPVHADETH